MFRADSRVMNPAASPRINPGVHDLSVFGRTKILCSSSSYHYLETAIAFGKSGGVEWNGPHRYPDLWWNLNEFALDVLSLSMLSCSWHP